MTGTLTLYSFEGTDGAYTGEFTTMDYDEALRHAGEHGLAVIANEYEWADSEVLDDYRETPEDEGCVCCEPAEADQEPA